LRADDDISAADVERIEAINRRRSMSLRRDVTGVFSPLKKVEGVTMSANGKKGRIVLTDQPGDCTTTDRFNWRSHGQKGR
jgi:hypothetical protein